jgi:hypothetical protein
LAGEDSVVPPAHQLRPASGSNIEELKMKASALPAFCLASIAILAQPVRAALSDEIQVYTDDINAPREFGLELHANFTPDGRRIPEYPGEVVPHRGLRLTPEFSYGLTGAFEAGLYVPASRDRSGSTSVAGWKARLKWLPIRGSEEEGGWFLGANGELSRLSRKFSASRDGFELRLMGGYRTPGWLVAVNPVFGWDLSPGFREKTPDFAVSMKASRRIAEGLSVGAEYYSGLGRLNKFLPQGEQDNTLYAAIDYEAKSWSLNFGAGRGLTDATDKTTVKAIIGFQF